MRHIILAFILLVAGITLALVLYVWAPNRIPAAAMSVNDRKISSEELDSSLAKKDQYGASQDEAIQQLITNELLIQEAKRLGIDREKSFREAMENFYEQSLIKILLDRKHSSLEASVSEGEIDRYLDLLRTKVTISLLAEAKGAKEERLEMAFAELSPALRLSLLPLNIGELSPAFRLKNQRVRCRLDAITPMAITTGPGTQDRAKIRDQLIPLKKESSLAGWIDDLHARAYIIMPKPKDQQP